MQPTSSAIEGLLMLRDKYKIEEDNTDVAWIYDEYSSKLQQDLVASKRLTEKGLQHVVMGLVPLLYGRIGMRNNLLTTMLYSSMPARHRQNTTW